MSTYRYPFPDHVVFLKYRDTRPKLLVTLLDPDGDAVDLSAMPDVKLHVALENRSDRLTRDMVIESPATSGKVSYQWEADDWDPVQSDPPLLAGTHRMEYEVIDGTDRQTYPNGDDILGPKYDTLVVSEDLGQG